MGYEAKNKRSRQHAAGQREPWLLATSLHHTSTFAKKTVKIYRLRMCIEEGFRDIKSHRFGLGLTYHRISSANRLQVLLLIATLAIIVLWLLGMALVLRKNHYQFQANSVRYKRVLSILFIGFQTINNAEIKISMDDIVEAWTQLNVIQESFGE